MSCANLDCVANAVCVQNESGGATCECEPTYEGNGFKSCTFKEGLEERDILLIVLVLLLFVALAVIVIFFICKKRIKDGKTMRQPLVGTMEVTPYDSKWETIAEANKSDGPPPYEEKKAPTTMETFHAVEVTEDRVPVVADEIDEADDALAYDNPSYDTVASTNDDETPTDDEVVVTDPVVDDVPVMEGQLESSPAEIRLDVGELEGVSPEVAEEEEKEQVIAVTFTEGDLPNTVSAHVTTPDASLTINLNINLPEEIVPIDA